MKNIVRTSQKWFKMFGEKENTIDDESCWGHHVNFNDKPLKSCGARATVNNGTFST